MNFTAVLYSLVLTSTLAHAGGDPQLGQLKAPSCVFCHGQNGIADNPAYPHLQGQNEQYLYQAMKAYQDGQRIGPMAQMMRDQLRQLNDEDLRDVAAFFAAQE
ncbi:MULTISPECIES: c-type cytochrome [unclassified Vibrio]|uniref:c-type cytochrome n=1 Tax=unclassified Vibrio TaxID=2614977 RepID=UPI0013614464|nr:MULTISPECIES: cytochrome c [unclassified Vibrio]NAW56211.1 c-type cytochrome [Vibrio sp. V36_P2S2PM302]NAX25268.1 c-type cytochrome [Vibrio sp. V38_P2S17PM301]NAX31092.1 c-type cytochrome [Vibrio sp. V37_P2S8PM304]